MLLQVVEARCLDNYRIHVKFNDGVEGDVDLKDTISKDHRAIFKPLLDLAYFSGFRLDLNTVCWPNGLDLAPEHLKETMLEQAALCPMP